MALSSPPKLAQDLFSRLPGELLLEIVKGVPSLSSLWSITQASPTVAALLDESAVEIVDAVISNTVPISTQGLMRAVLRLQASSKEHPCPFSLEEARTISYRKSIGRCISQEEYINLKLSRASCRLDSADCGGVGVVSEFLSLAHNIHMQVHGCVEHHIQRSMSMRPASLVEWIGSCSSSPLEKIRWCYENSKGQRYNPQKTGAASWVEEQRVVRAFWRIELYWELKAACASGHLQWPKSDLEFVESANLSDFFSVREFEREQFLAVYDYIQELGGTRKSDQLSGVPASSEFFDSCPATSPFAFYDKADRFEQGERFLERKPLSFQFQEGMARDSKRTPVPGLPFQPYRKFGFAFWDEKRMSDLGFSRADKLHFLNRTMEYYFTWYSVLTEEEKNMPGTRVPHQYGGQ